MFGPSYPERRPVVVNTKTGLVFRGIVWKRDARFLVLKGAELVQGSERTPVDGEVLIEAANVDFVQVLGGD